MILEGANLTGVTLSVTPSPIPQYWFYSYQGNESGLSSQLSRDSSNNFYTLNYSSYSGGSFGYNKLTADGVSQGFNVYSNIGSLTGTRIPPRADANGNVFLHLTVSGNTSSLLKTNAAGNVQFAKSLRLPNANVGGLRAIASNDILIEDAGSNIYVIGWVDSVDDRKLSSVWKIDQTTSNIVWAKSYGNAGANSSVEGMLYHAAFTADGNIIVTGSADQPNTGNQGIDVIRVDTQTGNIINQYNYKSTGFSDTGYYIQEDSTGNIIIAGTSVEDGVILKTYANGSIIWQKSFADPYEFFETPGALDASDDIYLGGSSSNKLYKIFGANGNVAWINIVNYGSNAAPGLCVVNGNALYVGFNPSVYKQLIGKLPLDGTGLGTYTGVGNNIIYSATTTTSGTPTFTLTTGNRVGYDINFIEGSIANVNQVNYSNVTITLSTVS